MYYMLFGLKPDEAETVVQSAVTSNQNNREKQKKEKEAARKREPLKWGTQITKGQEVNEPEATAAQLWHAAISILDCVENVSQSMYFGKTVTLDILRGVDSEKIQKYYLVKIPQYGALKAMDRKIIYTVMEWLIENEYLLQTKSKYPVIHPTYNGRHFQEMVTEQQWEDLERRVSLQQ